MAQKLHCKGAQQMDQCFNVKKLYVIWYNAVLTNHSNEKSINFDRLEIILRTYLSSISNYQVISFKSTAEWKFLNAQKWQPQIFWYFKLNMRMSYSFLYLSLKGVKIYAEGHSHFYWIEFKEKQLFSNGMKKKNRMDFWFSHNMQSAQSQRTLHSPNCDYIIKIKLGINLEIQTELKHK